MTMKSYPRMSPIEYERTRKLYGMTDEEFAEMIGVALRQGQRYKYSESVIPNAVARLLRVAVQHGLSPDDITDAPTIKG